MTYYHVSRTSGITELKPRVPQDVEGECDLPRVCAAASVGAALESSCADLWYKDIIYIYAIEAPPDLTSAEVHSMGVEDAEDYGEVWWLSPVPCKCVDTVDKEV